MAGSSGGEVQQAGPHPPGTCDRKRHIFKGNQLLEAGSASQVQPGACVEICRDATLILQVLA